MIHIFRNEMKKWHTVLWVVLASMVLSSLGMVFFSQKNSRDYKVATVNGKAIYFDAYRRSLLDLQERVNALRGLARAYGMSEEVFLSTFFGASKPEALALDNCVKEVLLDQIKKDFNIQIDRTWFKQELLKSLPQLVDSSGVFNMDAYQRYLQKISTTPAEYEARKVEEFERNVIHSFVTNTSYVPQFVAQDIFQKDFVEKSFTLLKFRNSYFIDMAKKQQVSDADLDAFYQEHKEAYRIGEKRKAKYWQFSADQYVREVEVEVGMIRHFYDKHKATLFRIPPKIRVRHILFAHKDYSVAQKVYKQLTDKPALFNELAREYSEDKKTASNGGLLDYFSKGTHDAEFERAAFRLHTVGELSRLVKTKQGYEIIQLAERQQSAEKPFELVKDDIAKTLKTKRSLAALRGDLDILMRNVREDSKALDTFVQAQNLKSQETGWLSEDDIKGKELTSLLAKRLFSSDKRQSVMGYFTHDNYYVIYQSTGVEKSHVPALNQIKDKVLEDYYSEKAETLAKSTLKELRGLLLDKKMTLQQVADKYGAEVIKTSKAKKGSKVKELSNEEGISEKLFALTDPLQVLQLRQKDGYILAQLSEASPVEPDDFAKNQQKIIKQEKYKDGSLHLGAFIASLHRNAKIEVDHKILEGQNAEAKD